MTKQFCYKYDIVLSDKKDFILASCQSLEIAEKRLAEMYEVDKKLASYYKWEKINMKKKTNKKSYFLGIATPHENSQDRKKIFKHKNAFLFLSLSIIKTL